MPRPRTGRIREQLRTLRRFERQAAGMPAERAIRFIRIMKEHLELSHAAIAAEVGVSKPTVDRWWRIYREQGIGALFDLRQQGRNRRSPLDDRGLERLRTWLSRNPGLAQPEIGRWIADELGAEFSRTGLRDMLRRLDHTTPAQTVARALTASGDLADRAGRAALEILRALPDTCDIVEGNVALREALERILPDVDKVVVNIDTQSDLLDPAGYRPDILQMDAAQLGRRTARASVVFRRRAERPVGADVLDGFRSLNYPLHLYHPAHFVDYYYRQKAYLGTVFLFRRADLPPIARETIELLVELEPLLRQQLTALVLRHHYLNPADRAFYDALEEVASTKKLTVQQRRVVAYMLKGYSYKQTAGELGITIDAVKQHLGNVYRKTGTSGFVELFATYFATRFSPE